MNHYTISSDNQETPEQKLTLLLVVLPLYFPSLRVKETVKDISLIKFLKHI
jgi:hypothetical protein